MNTNSCVQLVYKLQFLELVTTSSQIAHRHYLALLFKAQSMITNRLRSHTDQRAGDQECPADQLKMKSGKSSGSRTCRGQDDFPVTINHAAFTSERAPTKAILHPYPSKAHKGRPTTPERGYLLTTPSLSKALQQFVHTLAQQRASIYT
ncbi:hypothetical protein CDAR_461321 [Caerostris darwini]|uniref:Uncharacterized protein n=1 Tax=Caerostris darwini TaxID=1538125 RepID=A0AAV4S8R6_9ARAC|nr:hypothetical protein CDAR_461321 [Caerostris darwini]